MTLTNWLIIASFAGPIFGYLSSTIIRYLFVHKSLRKKDWVERREQEVLSDLIRARSGAGGSQSREIRIILERALNAIPVFFHNNEEVVRINKKLFENLSNGNNELATQKME